MTDNFILCTLLNRPLDQLVTIAQVLDYSVCEFQNIVPFSIIVLQTAAEVILGTLMCLLAVIRFIRESLQMYRVTKQFEISRYLSLLTRDGILYFLGYVTPCPSSHFLSHATRLTTNYYGQHLVIFPHHYAGHLKPFMEL